jgi:hypothetical protein
MQTFWIDYRSASVIGTVPVAQCDAGFYLEDGASEAYSHNPDAYDAWCEKVRDYVAPVLSHLSHGATVYVDGWLFARNDMRDMNGRMGA